MLFMSRMEKGLCWTFFLLVVSAKEEEWSKPIVETTIGKVQGFKSVSREGQPYFEFRGIPYGVPPLGPLRYQAPQPAKKWEGVRDASEYGQRCLQFNMLSDLVLGSENCLFLNIFTSKISPKALQPVLFWIHGGHFMYGSSNEYNAEYWMDHQMVVVTLNYRLNSFGFLNIDGLVEGNMGLKDQNLALRWVKTNIDKFGGDPGRVTLAGQSAGGASVHYHILSPVSQGLFQKAVSFSGTALSPWAFTKEPTAQAMRLGIKLGCPTNTTNVLLQCLRSLDANTIVQVHTEISDMLSDRYAFFSPTKEYIEGKEPFLTENPHKLVEEGNVSSNKVPWITGVNSAEGLIFLIALFMTPFATIRLNSEWNVLAPRLLGFDELADPNKRRIAQKARSYYLQDKDFSEEEFQDILQLFSDSNFNYGFRTSAIAHSKQQPVYAYYYNHNGTFGFFQSFQGMSRSVPKVLDWFWSMAYTWFKSEVSGKDFVHWGPCHGDELAMLWRIPLIAHITSENPDYSLSRAMVKMLVDFATKEGDPTMNGVKWTPLSHESNNGSPLKMMLIGNKSEMIEEPFYKTVSMWDKEIAKDILNSSKHLNFNKIL